MRRIVSSIIILLFLTVLTAQSEDVVSDFESTKFKAEQGDALAQYILGLYYEDGQGVIQDYEEAVKWYRLAAEQGNAVAQNNLGFCYKDGEGVIQDYEEAVKWIRLAAEQGNEVAQNNLGLCYEHGEGVIQDYKEAYKWYLLAYSGSSLDYYGLLSGAKYRVKKELTQSKIEGAIIEAKEIEKGWE
ncbi:MAG: tetratricopeptide repeat protein [Candidatus Tenebribacter davisii]|nr:tetratricopeptide repeat protein [Candidatus Tenebribacter davisii]